MFTQQITGSDRNHRSEAASGVAVRTQVFEQHSTQPETWYRWLFRQLCLPEHSQILELGCGPCDLWVKNWPRISESWRIFACDYSETMAAEGALRIKSAVSPKESPYRPRPDQFHFFVSDAGSLPFAAGRWDVVLAIGLLDLVDDAALVLNHIWAALKPGGRLYASGGGQSHLREMEAIFSLFLPGFRFGGNPERFGLDNGAFLLSSGFENISLARYHDDLVFTTVGPIMAFALSEEVVSRQLSEANRDLLERCLADLLSERGEIRVTAEKGVFVATKAGRRPDWPLANTTGHPAR